MDQEQTQLNRAPSAAEIRSRIERRRNEMDQITSTLHQRLEPHHLAEEVASAVKRKLQTRSARARSAVMTSVRENPLPWLAIGGGLAWLVLQSRREHDHERHGGYPRGYDYGHGYRHDLPYREVPAALRYSEPGPGAHEDTGLLDPSEHRAGAGEKAAHVKEKLLEATENARHKVAEVKDTAKEKVHAASEHTREKVTHAVEQTREKAVETKQRVAARATELKHEAAARATDLYGENPLLVGAAAFGVGALLAMAIPPTPVERRTVGPVHDRLAEKAKERTREVAAKVEEEVTHKAEDAIDKLASQDQGGGDGHATQSPPHTVTGGGSKGGGSMSGSSISGGAMGGGSSTGGSSTGIGSSTQTTSTGIGASSGPTTGVGSTRGSSTPSERR